MRPFAREKPSICQGHPMVRGFSPLLSLRSESYTGHGASCDWISNHLPPFLSRILHDETDTGVRGGFWTREAMTSLTACDS